MTSPADDSQGSYQISCLWSALCALLTAAGSMLASCGTPVGRAPDLQGPIERPRSLPTRTATAHRWCAGDRPRGSPAGIEFVEA